MSDIYVDQLKEETDEKIATGDCLTYGDTTEIVLDSTLGWAHIFTPPRQADLIARYLAEGWRKAYVEFMGNQGKLFLKT